MFPFFVLLSGPLAVSCTVLCYKTSAFERGLRLGFGIREENKANRQGT
jgi:hypothetical protein